jgi:hypothetical protein
LANCSENRKAAYRFIVRQREKISLTQDKLINDSNSILISLDEMAKLKGGLVDPSPVLVQALKKLLSGVVSEVEINKYLVKPFR